MNKHERMARMLEARIRRDFPHMADKVHVGYVEPKYYTPKAALDVALFDPVMANPKLGLHGAK